MSRTRFVPAALVSLALCSAVLALTAAAPAKKGGMSRDKMVERGKYLTTVMSCIDCHTPGTLFGAPDFSRQLSGSELGWKGPWGVTFPRNLTPDMETGLGKWTEAQIVTAIRTGVRPDGSGLMPPMPWQNFTGMTDDDANAIAAYLKSIPAVSHKVPDKVAPDGNWDGAMLVFPPPPAWDAPREAATGEKH